MPEFGPEIGRRESQTFGFPRIRRSPIVTAGKPVPEVRRYRRQAYRNASDSRKMENCDKTCIGGEHV